MKKLGALLCVFAALLFTGCPERPTPPPPVEEEPAPPVDEMPAEETPVDEETGL